MLDQNHWSYRKACEMVDEAMTADFDGLNKLVQALLMKAYDNGPCKGHGACLVTGQCPYKPSCRGEL